ncbi:MAG: hypothetical protein ACLFM3_08230, partial [Desulfohalobiaceae bacterium]
MVSICLSHTASRNNQSTNDSVLSQSRTSNPGWRLSANKMAWPCGTDFLATSSHLSSLNQLPLGGCQAPF